MPMNNAVLTSHLLLAPCYALTIVTSFFKPQLSSALPCRTPLPYIAQWPERYPQQHRLQHLFGALFLSGTTSEWLSLHLKTFTASTLLSSQASTTPSLLLFCCLLLFCPSHKTTLMVETQGTSPLACRHRLQSSQLGRWELLAADTPQAYALLPTMLPRRCLGWVDRRKKRGFITFIAAT